MSVLPPLPAPEFSQRLADELQQARHNLNHRFLAHRRPLLYFREHDAALTRTLTTLWPAWFGAADVCLLAIGGFGRGEVYPHSDLDLAVVTVEPPAGELAERLAAWVQTLWDMGLRPALQTGSIAQLCHSARHNLASDTALLEGRHLCGRADLAEGLQQALSLQRDLVGFIEGKIWEQQQRHAQSQGAGAMLEANVKTAPGGLRDIHTLLWLATAQGIDPGFHALVRRHILTRNEAGLLHYSHKQLARIRINLHLAAQRPQERLLFDVQSQVAAQMGYVDQPGARASEQLMRTFYRATKIVAQLSGILLPMLRGRVYSPLPRVVADIDADYYQVGNLLAVRDKKLFAAKPTHVFKAMQLMQQRSDLTGLAPQTLRAWWAAGQKIDAAFYRNPVNRDRFIGFFRHGHGLTHLLRFLNLYGVLGRYLPAWGQIVGLLQHDLFHIYPVDDHILTVVRNVRRLAMDAHSHELPFASALMQGFAKPHMLYLAALFHDIAKGRGGDHAREGVTDARRFAADHFLSAEEGELLAWLVEHHLLLSGTAQKEDIQDAQVVARFCRRVGNTERLIALYLLTVADIRGTNPKLWNGWKASLLQNLFQAAWRHLSGERTDPAQIVLRRQQQAADTAAGLGLDAAAQQALWQALGEAYFLRHEAEDIAWHIGLIARAPHTAQAHIRDEDNGHTLAVMVYMPNAPRLFAGLSHLFSQHHLDILAARAYVTEHNFVLDSFILQLPETSLPHDCLRIRRRLAAALQQFVRQSASPAISRPATPHSRRSRHLPIAPHIRLSAEDTPGWYLLELVAVNRRHLLANIAGVLSDFDIGIRYAKITTLDERVEDSFLIYAPHLADTQRQLALQQALLAQIEA